MFLFLFHTLYKFTSNIYELFCLRLFFLWETVPAWESCMRGGWAGRIWAEGSSATDPLNMTCSMDTTSGLLFSLCNWADNVPWFPLFCTSICSAWAVRCVLASWKWSGVSKRSGYSPPPPPPAPLLQLCRWAFGIATAVRQEFTKHPVLHFVLKLKVQGK